jgi:DNA-binding NarL/FixJ family response regulator
MPRAYRGVAWRSDQSWAPSRRVRRDRHGMLPHSTERSAVTLNLLVISSQHHVLEWVREAFQAVSEIFTGIRDVQEVDAGVALLQSQAAFGLVLLDLDSTDVGSLAVMKRMWSARPGANIAVTRWLTSEIDLVVCIKAGALGYFPKELSPRALADAMLLVAQGVLWCPNLRLSQAPCGLSY